MYSVLKNTTRSRSTVVGYLTGGSNTEGGSNVFVGSGAGSLNNTGTANVFVGNSAGAANTIGGPNTRLRAGANFSSNNLSCATAIGANSLVTTSNTVVLGRGADTVSIPGSLVVVGTFSNPSDARLKTGI